MLLHSFIWRLTAMGTLLSFNLLQFVNSVYATHPNPQPPTHPNKNPIKYYPTNNRQPKLHLITPPTHSRTSKKIAKKSPAHWPGKPEGQTKQR
jgi:hypothetical protein